MSLFNQLECLEASGLITDSQLARMKKISASLPHATGDLLAIIAAASLSQGDTNLLDGTPIGVQSLSSTGTADVKSLTVPADTTKAVVTVHTNNIIFRLDGTAPTITSAHVGIVNTTFMVGNLAGFKFAGQATAADIFVTYY